MATRGFRTWPWADTAPDHLPAAEALVLDASRAWVEAAAGRGLPPLLAARLVLAAEDLGDAAPALDALLRALVRPPTMGCRACPRITPAEATLLTGVALSQRGPRREALAVFLRIAPPPSAYAAMGPAIGLGRAFRRAGLLLAQALRATG